jgi:murein DD-endopeptidase MepM/ murein hydrolase activator NlpD
MKNVTGWIILAAIALVAMGAKSGKWLARVVSPVRLRDDAQGSGQYGAPRSGHTHMGTDLVVTPGQPVVAPTSGTITRIAYPYANDLQWQGLEMMLENGLVMKLFYMAPLGNLIGQKVTAGTIIGYAQDISRKYGGGMLDHIHIELFENGNHINPEPYIF